MWKWCRTCKITCLTTLIFSAAVARYIFKNTTTTLKTSQVVRQHLVVSHTRCQTCLKTPECMWNQQHNHYQSVDISYEPTKCIEKYWTTVSVFVGTDGNYPFAELATLAIDCLCVYIIIFFLWHEKRWCVILTSKKKYDEILCIYVYTINENITFNFLQTILSCPTRFSKAWLFLLWWQ